MNEMEKYFSTSFAPLAMAYQHFFSPSAANPKKPFTTTVELARKKAANTGREKGEKEN